MGAHSRREHGPEHGPEEWRGLVMGRETPFLALDVDAAVAAYKRIGSGLAGITPYYAVKCQPHGDLLAGLAAAGARFEVASAREIRRLMDLGVAAGELVFSHPVKSPTEIMWAYRQGVRVFAFDSAEELVKLVAGAPGAGVVVRLATAAGSEVPLGKKFGVDPVEAARLLVLAKDRGMDPLGITWHVGSQCLDPAAWLGPIEDAARVMRAVQRHGIRVRMIDVGGGFPAPYGFDPVPPDIATYGRVIGDGLDGLLPYEPETVIAEPGRAVVAEAGTLVARVRGTTRRGSERWAHLEVGAWHGIPEGLETGAGIPQRVSDFRADVERDVWTLTGPTCTGTDTWARGVELSAHLRAGDLVVIGCAGAYCYGGGFCGLDGPYVVPVGERIGGGHVVGIEGAGTAGGSAFCAGSPAEPAPGTDGRDGRVGGVGDA